MMYMEGAKAVSAQNISVQENQYGSSAQWVWALESPYAGALNQWFVFQTELSLHVTTPSTHHRSISTTR